MKYTSPKETIIVNVVSAKSQFSTCISTKLTQVADPTGCRTLLVILCTDKEDNMIEEVSALGLRVMGTYYVRQRNRNESYEEANEKEIRLFTTHVELSLL
ncbi:dynamin-related protein 4C-like protein, partial [Tanacetum coccineum]